MKQKGTVYLVGAGPGDAGLLTMRGAELIRRADVLVYDSLVNPELLRLAPNTAEIIFGGKRPKEHAISQEELNHLLIKKATEGKLVVRLKGGDPYLFGRGGEEAEELAAARIPFEVIPGVSSTVAAPNYAGIPVTHRAYCSSYIVITGHEDPAKEGASVDWGQIARLEGTKVILMGAERIRQIAESLIGRGMPAETPAAMIRWGTTGQQKSVSGDLGTIADLAARAHLTAPAITVIGDVVKLREKLNWFENKSLFGQRIVVTRARVQASELSRPLLDRGADVIEVPVIAFAPPKNKTDLTDALLTLHEYDWIVFTSPNGVSAFFNYFFKAFEDLRDLGGMRIAAIGPGTAARLAELHLKVDLMPKESLASRIADAFEGYQTIDNLRVLLMRAEVADPDLVKALEKLGAIVDDVACYQTVPESEDLTGLTSRILEEGADWITFTSASTVEHFHARLNLVELINRFPKLQLASIGPETSKALGKLGLKASLEATIHTISGLVEAIEKSVRSKGAERPK